MEFVLVVSTISRTKELAYLFSSLAQQSWSKFKVVLVDQNPDDRLIPVISEYSSQFPISHIKSAKGVSRGRNAGLAYLADGDIVAFPDDDCTYPPTLLERVAKLFEDNPDSGAITGRSVTNAGKDSNGRWDHDAGKVTMANVWNRATAFSIFARTSAMGGIRFDETLGPGETKANHLWGCGEDIDLVLQLLRGRQNVYFDPDLTVHHPDWSITGYTPAIYNKAKAYGRGMGRVLRKHDYPVRLVAYHLARPIGGTLLSIVRGRLAKARYHWSMFVGRLYGWSAATNAAD